MDVALYRCRFTTGKGKSCVLSSAKIMFFFRIIVWFLKKKLGFFEYCPFGSKKQWTFFRNPPPFTSYIPVFTSHLPPFTSYIPVFTSYLPTFSTNLPVFSPYFPTFISSLPPLPKMQHTFLSCSFRLLLCYAYRCVYADTCSHIAHSPSSEFLPSPFTFTFNHLKTWMICVKASPIFTFTQ